MLNYRPYPVWSLVPAAPVPYGCEVSQGWYCAHCEVFNSPTVGQCPSCLIPKKSEAGMPEQ